MVKSLDDLRLSVTRSSLLTNPIFLSTLFIISMAFILYVFISYYTKEENKQYKTYLNADLTDNQYLFNSDDEQNSNYQEKPTQEQCIELCKLNTKCDGMTYNEDTQKCLLTEEGQFRDGNINHYSWQKPRDQKNKITVKTNILDYTNNAISVSKYRIPPPRFMNSFCYSFWINITDWYTNNYGYWKHVFHKGTHMEHSRKSFKTWDEIEKNIPDQMIGVWLAPYNNNMRICYNVSEFEYSARSQEESNLKTETETPEYINGNHIELYEGINYTGHKTKIYLSSTDVENTNLNQDGIFSPDKLLNLKYRPNRLSSIKVPHSTKIVLMDSDNNESEIIDKNIYNLSNINFNNKMTKFILKDFIPSRKRLKLYRDYFDITNININIPTHILVNFNDNYFDVYVNGNLIKTETLSRLDSPASNNSDSEESVNHIQRQFKMNNGNLYAKYPSSFSGSIYNLGYIPEYLSSENIEKIFNDKPSFNYDKSMDIKTLALENFTSELVNNVMETDINTYDD